MDVDIRGGKTRVGAVFQSNRQRIIQYKLIIYTIVHSRNTGGEPIDTMGEPEPVESPTQNAKFNYRTGCIPFGNY